MFGRKRPPQLVAGRPNHSVPLVRDAGGSPAVDLIKVRAAGHVDLAKRAEKVGISLSKRNLSGMRAEVVLIVDHSGSMAHAYQSGQVQRIAERALGFALQVDLDGQVPVIAFDSGAKLTATASVDTYQGIVAREVYRPARMGSTNLAAALRIVRTMAEQASSPLVAVVVTDGFPNSQDEADAELVALSYLPCWVKILGTTESARAYLEHVDDDLPGRLVDNVDAKIMLDPDALSDLEFADAMTDEWAGWVSAGQTVGLLT